MNMRSLQILPERKSHLSSSCSQGRFNRNEFAGADFIHNGERISDLVALHVQTSLRHGSFTRTNSMISIDKLFWKRLLEAIPREVKPLSTLFCVTSTRRSAILVVALGLLFTACGGPPASLQEPVSPCASHMNDRTNWKLIDKGFFSFELPSRFQVPSTNAVGADSWVGSYGTPNKEESVSFDYGQWSGEVTPDSSLYANYHACSETIGGHSATIVTLQVRDPRVIAMSGAYVAAASWKSPIAAPAHLTIWAQAHNSRDLAELLTVLRTVKFRKDSNAAK